MYSNVDIFLIHQLQVRSFLFISIFKKKFIYVIHINSLYTLIFTQRKGTLILNKKSRYPYWIWPVVLHIILRMTQIAVEVPRLTLCSSALIMPSIVWRVWCNNHDQHFDVKNTCNSFITNMFHNFYY